MTGTRGAFEGGVAARPRGDGHMDGPIDAPIDAPGEDPGLARLCAALGATAEEERALASMKRREKVYRAGAQVVVPGVAGPGRPGAPLGVIREGWACRSIRFPDGTRQILEFLLPGDLVGLQARLLDPTDYGVGAMTRLSLSEFDERLVERVTALRPRLLGGFLRLVLEERRRADRRLAVLGRRHGAQRIGYFMMELFRRLERLGMTDGDRCRLPLRRRHWADVAGMSGTHVARSLDELRGLGLASLDGDRLAIHDAAALAAFSGFREEPRG